jgi:FkbM family methyltransferase
MIKNIDWGQFLTNPTLMSWLKLEFDNNQTMEKFEKVKEGDIVVDLGASVGPFTLSIIDSYPSKVICVEPSFSLYQVLLKNLRIYSKDVITTTRRGIYYKNCKKVLESVFFDYEEVELITFEDFISEYSLGYIDFLKTDIEGNEYYFFTDSTMDYIKNHVKYIAGEFHLHNPELKQMFRIFRDKYLTQFKRYEVYDVTLACNIKWDLFNDHFINWYNQVIFYIWP